MGRSRKKLMQQYPDEPWMWQKDWASGKLSSINTTSVFVAIVFSIVALLVNIFGWIATISVFTGSIATSDKAVFLVLLVPVAGFGLAIWAVQIVIAYFKFGKSFFIMASVPGVIGGELRGVVETSVNIIPEEGFRTTLRCIRRTSSASSGSNSNSNVRTDILWEDSRVMKKEILESDLTRSHIPILFPIPYEAQQTDFRETSKRSSVDISWQLEIEAKVPGMDYSAKFYVPVFKTPESSEDFIFDEAPVADYTAKVDVCDELKAANIKIEPLTNGGTRYTFPIGGMLKSAALLSFFSLCFVGATVAIFILTGAILFSLFFTLFSIICVLFAISLWTKPTIIEASPDLIVLTGSLLCSNRRRELDPKDVTNIAPQKGMSSGDKHYFGLKIFVDGKLNGVTVGGGILGLHVARKLADEVKLAISKHHWDE